MFRADILKVKCSAEFVPLDRVSRAEEGNFIDKTQSLIQQIYHGNHRHRNLYPHIPCLKFRITFIIQAILGETHGESTAISRI